MKKILSFIVMAMLFILIGCKTKQVPIQSQQVRNDTVFVERIKTIQVPVENTIYVDEPCDSLGMLKQFKQTFKAGGTRVVIQSNNGRIEAKINMDSIKNVWEREFKQSNSDTVITKTVEVPVEKPIRDKKFWIGWIGFISALIWIFRKYIYRFIKWIVAKFFPAAKLLP